MNAVIKYDVWPPYNSEWYAAYVQTGKEDDVKLRLEYKFENHLGFFIPKRQLRERKGGQWRDVIHTMFPGYILVNGHIGVDEYYSFKDIPGFWRLLTSDSRLLPIPPKEIGFIEQLMCRGEIIGSSDLEEYSGNIRIIDGPLTGMEGSIVKIDHRKGRAKVKLTFLNEERIIDLTVSMLKKA